MKPQLTNKIYEFMEQTVAFRGNIWAIFPQGLPISFIRIVIIRIVASLE